MKKMDVAIQIIWDNLDGKERIVIMKKATGLLNPTAVEFFNHAPEQVVVYLENIIWEAVNRIAS